MLVGTLTGIGSQVLSFTAQAKQAKKQQQFYDDYRKKYIKSVWEDYSNNVDLLELSQDQKEDAIGFENQQSALSNMQAKATAEASALESGVSGNSIDSLLRGYDRTMAINDFVSAENIRMMGLQTNQEIKALRAKAISAINTGHPFDPNSIVKPSIGANLLTGLNNAATGLQQGYTIGKTLSKPRTTGVNNV